MPFCVINAHISTKYKVSLLGEIEKASTVHLCMFVFKISTINFSFFEQSDTSLITK